MQFFLPRSVLPIPNVEPCVLTNSRALAVRTVERLGPVVHPLDRRRIARFLEGALGNFGVICERGHAVISEVTEQVA